MQPRSTNETAEYHFDKGFELSKQGKYVESIAEYSEAIRLDPANAAAYNNRGVAYKDLGKFTEAIADYNEVIRLNPASVEAYRNRGYAYDELGQYSEAIADFNEAIRLKPENVVAYNNRGVAYKHLEKFTEAIQDYKKALAINPNYARAKDNLKKVQKAQSKHQLTLLSQRAKDTFSTLFVNGKSPADMPAALLNMMNQEHELLDALLEHLKKSDELDADVATDMSAAINQLRRYPLVAHVQPLRDIPDLTLHVVDYLHRRDVVNYYIASVRQALFQIRDVANAPGWKVKHWLTGRPVSGTPRHINLIRQQLASINEYSSAEVVMAAYGKMISLIPATPKKSRLPETTAFYDAITFNLNNIMFNPPAMPSLVIQGPVLPVLEEAPPSYDEYQQQEQKQLAVLMARFPGYSVDITADAYFLRSAEVLYPIIISKNQFDKDVASYSKPVAIQSAPLFSQLGSAAIAEVPAAVITPVISSSSSSFFAAKPVALSAADAAAVDLADELERKLPPVPTHALPSVESSSDSANEPAQRQMMFA